MKKILLMAMLLFTAFASKAETFDGTTFLKSLSGTYVELFSSETCLSPALSALWHTEAAKYVGEDKADDAVHQLVGGCQGSITGEQAVSTYANGKAFKFCCTFQQGVNKITFKGNRISGVDKQGTKLFSHKHHFVEKDSEGNYIYESNDKNNDEFRFFWMRPDSPSGTHHIEFRYGSDKEQLTQLMTGKYAYWMASAVKEGHEEEWKQSIILFVGENLGAKEYETEQ